MTGSACGSTPVGAVAGAGKDGALKGRRYTEAKRDFIPQNARDGAEVSLRRPTHSQERMRKKKSACSVRNDGEEKETTNKKPERTNGKRKGKDDALKRPPSVRKGG